MVGAEVAKRQSSTRGLTKKRAAGFGWLSVPAALTSAWRRDFATASRQGRHSSITRDEAMTQTIFRRRAFATIATAAGVGHHVAGARQLQGTWRTRLSKSDRSHDPAWHSRSSRPAHSAVEGQRCALTAPTEGGNDSARGTLWAFGIAKHLWPRPRAGAFSWANGRLFGPRCTVRKTSAAPTSSSSSLHTAARYKCFFSAASFSARVRSIAGVTR